MADALADEETISPGRRRLKGNRLLRLVAERADGWNPLGVDARRLPGAGLRPGAGLSAAGRDPATVTRSLGLYALAGEDQRDLERRYERCAAWLPAGCSTRSAWTSGSRLIGTVAEVAEQAAEWRALRVADLILGAGPLPFSVTAPDDLEPLAVALAQESSARVEGPEPARAVGGR